LLHQAAKSDRKKRVARRYIESELASLRMKCEQIRSGDTSPLDDYEVLAGAVPTAR
jgi:hypothetical protein